MRLFFSFLLALFCSSIVWGEEQSYTGKVLVIEVGEKSLVNKQSFKFWQRTLARASEEQARAVIFQLDTPGGLAIDTKDLMVQELRDLEVPSYAFVDDEAISAGAMISIACDSIWMTPGSTIGAAAIVNGTGAEIEKVMRGKLESFFDANIRAVTQENGHPTEIAQMMMFIDDEKTRRYGPVKLEKGKLLTLTAEEAVQLHKGQPVLADGIVKDLDALVAQLGFAPGDVVVAQQTGFERLAWHISAWSSVLILIGIGGLYFEMKSPGFGLGAGVAAVAFGVFFFGNFVAGNLAGYEVIGLFLLGLVLIIVELTLFPSLILGLIGTVLMIASLLLAMVDKFDFERIGSADFFTGEKFSWVEVFTGPMVALAIGLIGGLFLIFLMMRLLPAMPVPGIILQRAIGGGRGASSSPADASSSASDQLVGKTGTALMDLRPAGKADLDGQRVDVITKGEFLPKGTAVKVIIQEQMRIVVERAS